MEFNSDLVLPDDQIIKTVFLAIGNPAVAMLISLLVAIFSLGLVRGRKIGEIMETLGHSGCLKSTSD